MVDAAAAAAMRDGTGATRAHTGLSLAVTAFAVAFTLPVFVPLPLLWYRPLTGAWAFGSVPADLAMDWYGRVLFAALAGVVGYALGRRVPARWSVSARAQRFWATIAAMALLAAMVTFVVLMADRAPVPLDGDSLARSAKRLPPTDSVSAGSR